MQFASNEHRSGGVHHRLCGCYLRTCGLLQFGGGCQCDAYCTHILADHDRFGFHFQLAEQSHVFDDFHIGINGFNAQAFNTLIILHQARPGGDFLRRQRCLPGVQLHREFILATPT